MKVFYEFDIEFPGVDFSNYFTKSDTFNEVHRARLYPRKNEIELRILYDVEEYFFERIGMWAKKIEWLKFGSYIKISKETENNRVQRIDLSEARLCGMKTGDSSSDGRWTYVVILIDTVKLYFNPSKESVNTAEFYLPDAGFRVVEPFYSALFGYDGNFNIRRMQGTDVFYTLAKSEFRPEFNTYSKDKKKNRVASIIKEPKIQFKYNESITEAEAIFYSKVVSSLASFYHHIKVDYSLSRVYLPEHTIVIKKIVPKNLFEIHGSLWGFKIYWDFHKFLQSDWQKGTLHNFKLLAKAIELFNQSLLVDSNSEFLIRYHIIEICAKHQGDFEKFSFTLTRNAKRKKYDKALDILLETVIPAEHKLFKEKWKSIRGILDYKPMKSSLISFLESQNLKPSEFPISVKDLKALRDKITHGSIDQVDLHLLRKVNLFLYRINGILILNLMGINKWELNVELD